MKIVIIIYNFNFCKWNIIIQADFIIRNNYQWNQSSDEIIQVVNESIVLPVNLTLSINIEVINFLGLNINQLVFAVVQSAVLKKIYVNHW